MYDLNDHRDVIRQMRDAGMDDTDILKVLLSALSEIKEGTV